DLPSRQLGGHRLLPQRRHLANRLASVDGSIISIICSKSPLFRAGSFHIAVMFLAHVLRNHNHLIIFPILAAASIIICEYCSILAAVKRLDGPETDSAAIN